MGCSGSRILDEFNQKAVEIEQDVKKSKSLLEKIMKGYKEFSANPLGCAISEINDLNELITKLKEVNIRLSNKCNELNIIYNKQKQNTSITDIQEKKERIKLINNDLNFIKEKTNYDLLNNLIDYFPNASSLGRKSH